MGTVQNTFSGALKKLTGKGNLVDRVQKLKRLGAKANKKLAPQLLEERLKDQ